MKRLQLLTLSGIAIVAFSAQQAPDAPMRVTWLKNAQAMIGVRLSPVSVAGVARRTTRRAVVVGASAAAASASAQQQAQVQQAATVPATTGPPIGSTVSALPAGCVSAPKNNVQYFNCSGVYYRSAFQGNNLVYVVTQP